jgi:hypothetical protein
VTLTEIVAALGLEVVSGQEYLAREVTGGYASDLLSCVMARARAGNVWVTLQAHANVVAVASLLDLAAVIVTEGAQPDAAMRSKATSEGVVLLSTARTTYDVVGALVQLGIKAGQS